MKCSTEEIKHSAGEHREVDGPKPHSRQVPVERYALRPRMMLGAAVMALLILGCGSWAATARLSGAVIGNGSIIVERNLKKVQHMFGGIVAAIDVREGSRVEAGQRLVRLDETQVRAERTILHSQIASLMGRQARLMAERDGAEMITFPPTISAFGDDVRAIMAGESRLFKGGLHMRAQKREQIESRIAQLGEEIIGLTHQRTAREKEIAVNKLEIASVRDLQERKLTSVTRVYVLEREAARLHGERGSLIAQIARVNGQIIELQLQITTIEHTARTEAQRELRISEARLAELTEKLVAAQDRLDRLDIVAPQSGIVHQLAVHTVGGVVTPAEPVLYIVPADEVLTIEAKIPPHEIDQVRVGQSARLRFTAFNARTTPEVDGLVTQVSADAVQDPKTGQAYFNVRLAMTDEGRRTIADQRLVPGMPVEVFVTTLDRTAMSYLLKPLTDQFSRAFKER